MKFPFGLKRISRGGFRRREIDTDSSLCCFIFRGKNENIVRLERNKFESCATYFSHINPREIKTILNIDKFFIAR